MEELEKTIELLKEINEMIEKINEAFEGGVPNVCD